ncbi:alpha-L-fucosidase [Hydrotalea sp.]|uniref:alpha-L-fucosidase n=1 Tax=Hydrotalea sp. TaxID=2881279 RepID=UPI0026396C08|nr:alpha-L-fucosidase [Hydrotalea sp.]
MYKSILLGIAFFCCLSGFSQSAEMYQPSPQNLKARQWFQDAKFGLFIHWGPFSIPGSGEWVMNNRNITVKNYTRLMDFFNPIAFDANAWVKMAKDAGMQYITLITRHHDGFSMWNTQQSDFNIMNTPYHKDIVKMIADACHIQGMPLFFYYSLLDWRREDYSWTTGRTGKGTGRIKQGDWNHYIQFMKNQLTELLTQYGPVAGIWFDGYWDQLKNDIDKNQQPAVDWHLTEIYSLIHRLQPACLIGNNHHLQPMPGEDFQMFEKDLPGGNTSGFGGASISHLPLETCETINQSWGFNLADTSYKSTSRLVHYLVRTAGFGANFLLNIGPMPNGAVQPEFQERLADMGKWLKTYGSSIYKTRGGYLRPQNWGTITQTNSKVFVHVLADSVTTLQLPQFPFTKIKKVYVLKNGQPVQAQLQNRVLVLSAIQQQPSEPDRVIVVEGE